jgi:glycosyltransferase involved in cell wall biosynthesis
VIVPAHNSGALIVPTVESALAQSFAAIEVIVIDDGSSDDTAAHLDKFTDPRLRVIHQPHRGAPAALNAGLGLARGEYVGFLDHDDLWAPSKVERHLDCFRRYPEGVVTFSWYGLIDQHGRRIGFRTSRWEGPISFRELLAD